MFVVLLIIFGSILVGLIINSLGVMGNNILYLVGIGCFIVVVFIVKGKKDIKCCIKRECDV